MHKNTLLDTLRDKIAEHADSLEEIQDIIKELASTDWSKYSDMLARQECSNAWCGASVVLGEIIDNPLIVEGSNHYCVHCEKIMLARYSYPCDCCGLLYSRTNASRGESCKNHTYFVSSQLERNLGRAATKGLLATLTLRQWTITLNHFNRCCAYCGESQAFLEHYLPLTLGGGTTQYNCVPTCSNCNLRKKNKHPQNFERLYPQERIQAIKSWFAYLSTIPVIQHKFQDGDMVRNIDPDSPYYNAIGQVVRNQEYLLSCDVDYMRGIQREIYGDDVRFVRPYVHEQEVNLIKVEEKCIITRPKEFYIVQQVEG